MLPDALFGVAGAPLQPPHCPAAWQPSSDLAGRPTQPSRPPSLCRQVTRFMWRTASPTCRLRAECTACQVGVGWRSPRVGGLQFFPPAAACSCWLWGGVSNTHVAVFRQASQLTGADGRLAMIDVDQMLATEEQYLLAEAQAMDRVCTDAFAGQEVRGVGAGGAWGVGTGRGCAGCGNREEGLSAGGHTKRCCRSAIRCVQGRRYVCLGGEGVGGQQMRVCRQGSAALEALQQRGALVSRQTPWVCTPRASPPNPSR